MNNLLIVSDHPHARPVLEQLRNSLASRIDLVTDCDSALKEIVEKRPLVACIQEQIAGITGESVARHIRLLLGSDAPRFLLLYNEAAPPPFPDDLFVAAVTMAVPVDTLHHSLRAALQTALGSFWCMVAPSEPEPPPPPDSPEDHDAGFTVVPVGDDDAVFLPAPSPAATTEEDNRSMQGLLQDQPGGPPAEPEAAVEPAPPPSPPAAPPLQTIDERPAPPPPKQDVPAAVAATASPGRPAVPPSPGGAPQPQPSAQPASRTAGAAARKAVPPDTPVQPPAPADRDDADHARALLHSLETEHLRQKRTRRMHIVRGLLAAVALGASLYAAYWYGRWSAVPAGTAPLSAPGPAGAAPAPPPRPAPRLPSFIPPAGHDAAFSGTAPGWSRYLTHGREYRLLHADSRLTVLQVIARNDASLDAAELSRILQEVTGYVDYRVEHRETRDGLYREQATVHERADLLIYRTAAAGPIRGVVLSLHK